MSALSRKERRALEATLRDASSYAEWRAAAEALDVGNGMEVFKRTDESPDYDAELIRERLEELRVMRRAGDAAGLVFLLRQGLYRNLGNLANPRLYDGCIAGPKTLIDDYVTEVVRAVNHVTEPSFKYLSDEALYRFLKDTLQSFGRSALLLSGGANFGLFHIGVAKALWDEGLLPRVFSGASTGALVVGMLGTRTDDELDDIFTLSPRVRFDCWERVSLVAARRTGAIFDPRRLESVVRNNIGDMTFLEAFEATGRSINISVSAVPSSASPRLLNHLTAPNVLVWSAVMASCALPGFFPPVVMRVKNPRGETERYLKRLRWIDGSMRSDLPMRRLGEIFNVNHHVVSQANPHIAPFVPARDERTTVWQATRDMALGEAMHRTQQALSVLQMASPFRAAEDGLAALEAIIRQTYRGDITVSPPTALRRYLKVTGNVPRDEALAMVRDGERATWSHMAMIRNQTKVGQTLERCVRRAAARLDHG